MRFMMMVKATKESEAGIMPSEELLTAMGKFNEEMIKAGILLSGDGLQSSSKGARVTFKDGKTIVTDGPFTETKELVAGYWIIKVDSLQEAVDWAKRCPHPMPDSGEAQIEIRQFFEIEDFGQSEGVELHKSLRDELTNSGND